MSKDCSDIREGEIARNSPIEKLIADFEQDGFDFSNIDLVRVTALRYVETMKDSQVRTLLYVLASTSDNLDIP